MWHAKHSNREKRKSNLGENVADDMKSFFPDKKKKG